CALYPYNRADAHADRAFAHRLFRDAGLALDIDLGVFDRGSRGAGRSIMLAYRGDSLVRRQAGDRVGNNADRQCAGRVYRAAGAYRNYGQFWLLAIRLAG